MEDRRQKNVKEAAEKFAGAIMESFRAVSDRAVSAQELNAELTQNFFNGVINNLRTQAEDNRQAAEQLAEQQQRQAEATQTLAQESVGAYMDFVNSMFSYYQGNLEQTQQTRPAGQGTGTGQSTGAEGSGDGTEDENRQAIREIVEEANRRSGL